MDHLLSKEMGRRHHDLLFPIRSNSYESILPKSSDHHILAGAHTAMSVPDESVSCNHIFSCTHPFCYTAHIVRASQKHKYHIPPKSQRIIVTMLSLVVAFNFAWEVLRTLSAYKAQQKYQTGQLVPILYNKEKPFVALIKSTQEK